jgi:hypothetical protein
MGSGGMSNGDVTYLSFGDEGTSHSSYSWEHSDTIYNTIYNLQSSVESTCQHSEAVHAVLSKDVEVSHLPPSRPAGPDCFKKIVRLLVMLSVKSVNVRCRALDLFQR